MRVQGHATIQVHDHHVVTRPGSSGGAQHDAGCGGIDGGSHRRREVLPRVVPCPSAGLPEGGADGVVLLERHGPAPGGGRCQIFGGDLRCVDPGLLQRLARRAETFLGLFLLSLDLFRLRGNKFEVGLDQLLAFSRGLIRAGLQSVVMR